MTKKIKTRIQYLSKSDKKNRCTFFLYWKTDYIPGLPYDGKKKYEKGQVFFCDPHEHGHLRPEEVKRSQS